MRILELFSGVGAVSFACGGSNSTVCAVDINQSAMQVYRANFTSPTRVQEITSLSDDQLTEFGADLWWMSPPCQPFTRRGLQKDLEDSRSEPLLRLLPAIERILPSNLALENVLGFENSRTYERLLKTLERAGYLWTSIELCSSDFGLPNLRPRFFLVASSSGQADLELAPVAMRQAPRSVAEFLDTGDQLARWKHDLVVDAAQIDKFRHAINIATPESEVTRCFTSAYGRSVVRSGSYLQTESGFRRFSPSEVCRLLGFSLDFKLPRELSTMQLWKLIGNSVSIPCVQHVLTAFKRQRLNAEVVIG